MGAGCTLKRSGGCRRQDVGDQEGAGCRRHSKQEAPFGPTALRPARTSRPELAISEQSLCMTEACLQGWMEA